MSEANVEYDTHGRMRYHPDYHPNHNKVWLNSDEKYLINNYVRLGPEYCSLALGRTVGVIMTRVYELRKTGSMEPWVRGTKTHKRTREMK